MVCNNIPCDIPERDPPRTYIRTLWELILDSEPRANVLGNKHALLTKSAQSPTHVHVTSHTANGIVHGVNSIFPIH